LFITFPEHPHSTANKPKDTNAGYKQFYISEHSTWFTCYVSTPESVEKVDIDTTEPQADVNVHQHDHSFPETHDSLPATITLL